MIAGYADAALALEKPEYAKTAEKAAEFVLKHLRTKDGRLMRTVGGGLPVQAAGLTTASMQPKVNAFLEDYAFLVHGLLTLHDATNNQRWLDEAIALNENMTALFQDKEAGGFFFTSHDHEKLFARAKDQHDGATPSGNSIAALNLVRLARKTGQPRYRDQAEAVFKAFTATLKSNPESMATLVSALAIWLDESAKKADAGAPKNSGGGDKDDPVKVSAKVSPEKPPADGKQTLTVTLDIAKGWHVYANPAGNENLIPTAVQVSAKEKLEDAKIEYPLSKEEKDPAVNESIYVYEKQAEIKITFRRPMVNGQPDAGPLDVVVKYQACDAMKCLAPKTVKLQVSSK
jgi:uncharacterized protein